MTWQAGNPDTWEHNPDIHGRIKDFYEYLDYQWVQDSNACNKEGDACNWSDDNAEMFSLLGAIYKVFYGSTYWKIVSIHLMHIFGSFWEGPLIEWNDKEGRTYAEVLNFLEKHRL